MIVDVDPLQLQIGGAIVVASAVDAMLVRDNLPELEEEKNPDALPRTVVLH